MKYKLIIGIVLQLSFGLDAIFASGNPALQEALNAPTARSEFKANLSKTFRHLEKAAYAGEEPVHRGQKSVGKSVLFSAVVPGTGQLYAGSYIKGAAFLLIEAAAIFGQIHFNAEANDYEGRFETLADAEWTEDDYWDWIAQISSRDRANLAGLREFERATFSHFLPESKNQQYYENVGKYNQFIMGWRDFREDILGMEVFTLEIYRSGNLVNQDLLTISPTRNTYTGLRKDSNDNFRRATTLATVTLFNHVLSALDAGLTTKRLNRRVSATLQMQGMRYDTELVPALALGVLW